jgi:hypothetical protein
VTPSPPSHATCPSAAFIDNLGALSTLKIELKPRVSRIDEASAIPSFFDDPE